MLIGAALGTIRADNLSGWSREKLFLEFLECFIQQSKPTKAATPVILLMDHQKSHVTNNHFSKFFWNKFINVSFRQQLQNKVTQ